MATRKKPITETTETDATGDRPKVGTIVLWTPGEKRSGNPGPFPAIVVREEPFLATVFLPGQTFDLHEQDLDRVERSAP